MKNIGIVSYNIRCNFTNYGSALQSWALAQTIERLDQCYRAILIDYCPRVHMDSDPLNPMKKMWDKDDESRKLCETKLDEIANNFYKFDEFYFEQFNRTKKAYDCTNFDMVAQDENLTGFVCGSDTIFCIDEFGFDDGYYANFDSMKNGYTITYAASFGDSHFDKDSYKELDKRLQNFKAIALREYDMLTYVQNKVGVRVQKVLDPTLLLEEKDYRKITATRQEKSKYLLLYVRRHNQKMTNFARELARKKGWKIVEISLRATNDETTRAFYEAGVNEFLSLVKYAEFVVTNSFHGMIFSVQFKKDFVIFSREQCNTKIDELLKLFGLTSQQMITGEENYQTDINYLEVHNRIRPAREESIRYLKEELEKMSRNEK